MSNSNDRYKSIIKNFLKADFGYSKMERCVTQVRLKSEAHQLGVRVGWLEKSVKRGTISNHKKRRKKKSQSILTRVHFLVPRRQAFYKVIWKGLASTHREIDHPERKVVGSVELGITVWVLHIIKNRALVACPHSGWNRDVQGWIPKQQFAWVSIRAKDGTYILESFSGMSTSGRSTISPSIRTAMSCPLPIVSRNSTRMNVPVVHSSRSHISLPKPAIQLDFREKSTKENVSCVIPRYSFLSNRRKRNYYTTPEDYSSVSSFTIKSQNTERTFIDLDFEEVKNNSKTDNITHKHFKQGAACSEEVKFQDVTLPLSGTELKVSLSRSKTFSEKYTPEVDRKYQQTVEWDDSKCFEIRPSASFSSDVKLSSSRDSESRLFKLNDGNISPDSSIEKKQSILEKNLSVLIPDSVLKVKELEFLTDRKSLRESTLTPISIESKHTNKSSELSEQRCSTAEVEKENERQQKIEEIERYARWLAQGFESPVSSGREADDKAPNGRIVKHLRDDDIHQWDQQRAIEPLRLEKHRSKMNDRILDSRMFSISQAEKSSKRKNMNEPRGLEVKKELREIQEPPICFAVV